MTFLSAIAGLPENFPKKIFGEIVFYRKHVSTFFCNPQQILIFKNTYGWTLKLIGLQFTKKELHYRQIPGHFRETKRFSQKFDLVNLQHLYCKLAEAFSNFLEENIPVSSLEL